MFTTRPYFTVCFLSRLSKLLSLLLRIRQYTYAHKYLCFQTTVTDILKTERDPLHGNKAQHGEQITNKLLLKTNCPSGGGLTVKSACIADCVCHKRLNVVSSTSNLNLCTKTRS